jgi:polar amino acid transport system substrate-binding protein
LFLFIIAPVKSNDENKQENVLKVGTNAISHPFEFYDKNNKIDGFDIELIKTIAKGAGYSDVEVIDKDFGTLIPLLVTNKIDLIASRLTITDKRKENGNFISYLSDNLSIFVNSNNKTIKGIEDLDEKKVGTLFSSATDKYLFKDRNIDIIRYHNYENIIDDLSSNKIDAFIVNELIGNGLIKKNNTKNIKKVDVSISKVEYGFLVGKGKPDAYKKLQESFNNIKKDGTFDKIQKKWF